MESRIKNTPCTVVTGFDGFVDTIAYPIREKTAAGTEYFSTISEFASHLMDKSGKSCFLELATREERLGGNMPLFSKALLALGASVRCVGAMGYPTLHPAFQPLADSSNCQITSFCQPGTTCALEFEDGKLLLSQNDEINRCCDTLLRTRVPDAEVQALFSGMDCLALFNWSELTLATSLWALPLAFPAVPVFCDLSDCSARNASDLQELFDILKQYAERGPLTLSCNRNETEQIGRGLEFSETDPIQISRHLQALLPGSIIVLHLTDGSLAFSAKEEVGRKNVHFAKPKISTGGGDNFNAGFVYAQLHGLPFSDCLAFANALSGFYVSHAISPSLSELLDWMRSHEYTQPLSNLEQKGE